MYDILVVDDEMRIRSLIRKYAEFEGHTVTEAQDGMEAVRMCRSHEFDIILMDIMMPELDGFSACREIRKTCTTPIIMLSARGEEYDKINGFSIGIDDYVVKPFSPKELMLRIEAIMKRVKKPDVSHPTGSNQIRSYDDGRFCVDLTARVVTIDGEKTDMTPKEFDLLAYLIQNPNMALSRDQLIEKVWGNDFFGDDSTLSTHVKYLRKRLGRYGDSIVTLRGVGYRFDGK